MDLYVTARANDDDLRYEYFEFETKEGERITIGYETSIYDYYENNDIYSVHEVIDFNDAEIEAEIDKLEGAKFLGFSIYSEQKQFIEIEILEMTFVEGAKTVKFINPFKKTEVQANDWQG